MVESTDYSFEVEFSEDAMDVEMDDVQDGMSHLAIGKEHLNESTLGKLPLQESESREPETNENSSEKAGDESLTTKSPTDLKLRNLGISPDCVDYRGVTIRMLNSSYAERPRDSQMDQIRYARENGWIQGRVDSLSIPILETVADENSYGPRDPLEQLADQMAGHQVICAVEDCEEETNLTVLEMHKKSVDRAYEESYQRGLIYQATQELMAPRNELGVLDYSLVSKEGVDMTLLGSDS
ncbi:hypothetical protein GLAREA_03399 [Glarea lozoyensis ATCC 20868]|uniref:Uncharacterized protein n=1 Tax=Glarea lozoyensis (strain ATCC 20868 / MF5171) TaxID=1116229 RepID=S3CVJ2_GLAL2|nr:uncharacterized protein GLAREA_03399 [Glarea lozoyensis ATCC 20868]EPE30432.1 hypothetical protein GLAREA_03399 [Glarea lozoyensis ATCC 20868]